jgi:plasmid replication initiation protein
MTGFATENLHELAFQHNKLARAPMRLTNVEARIFALCLACLHQESQELSVEVNVKDVVAARNGEAYERVRDGCKGLTSNPVQIETVDSKTGLRTYVTTPLFAELRLEEGSGLLTGSFNEKLREHLLQLKQEFTRCDVQTLLTLKTAYAHRLYWVLKSWEKPLGTVTLDRQSLRDMLQGQDLGTQSYPLWADFKRFVLKPAIKELHGVGWNIECQEKRVGRTVTSVTFTIPIEKVPMEDRNTKKSKLSDGESQQYQDELARRGGTQLRTYMRMQLDYKLTEPQARHILDNIENQDMYLKLTKVLHDVQIARTNNVPIKNLAAYTVNLIKEALPGIFK